ncbi:MAG: hypothetical protein LJE84_11230 [Gammaproteobacteria bacterium]|nr:hypothetical protein [Gammaproteobacteria bacterium]
MGMLGNLFGGKPDFPALPPDSYANARLREVEKQLADLANETGERLEVVPSEHAAYVFIGKPPKRFGLAWVHNGEVGNFKTLVEKHRINPVRLERITDQLRETYESSADADRYQAEVAGHTVVITPSENLEQGVHAVINEALSG